MPASLITLAPGIFAGRSPFMRSLVAPLAHVGQRQDTRTVSRLSLSMIAAGVAAGASSSNHAVTSRSQKASFRHGRQLRRRHALLCEVTASSAQPAPLAHLPNLVRPRLMAVLGTADPRGNPIFVRQSAARRRRGRAQRAQQHCVPARPRGPPACGSVCKTAFNSAFCVDCGVCNSPFRALQVHGVHPRRAGPAFGCCTGSDMSMFQEKVLEFCFRQCLFRAPAAARP